MTNFIETDENTQTASLCRIAVVVSGLLSSVSGLLILVSGLLMLVSSLLIGVG